jgi:hypothetical protein
MKRFDSFSKENPHLQVIWSPTALAKFMQDPALYYLEKVEGWREDPPPASMKWGTIYHEALELFDGMRLEGKSVEQATEAAIMQAWQDAQEPIPGWSLDQMAEYSNRPSDTNRTLESMIRAICWYAEEFGEDDTLETLVLPDGTWAHELEFLMPLDMWSPHGEQYMLGGYLDRMVRRKDQDGDGEVLVLDRKSTTSSLGPFFKKKFALDVQVDTYALAAQVVYDFPVRGVMIEGTQVGKTFARFDRFHSGRSPSQLQEWLQDLKFWIKQAEYCAESGHWPCNRATTGLYGGNPLYEALAYPPHAREGILRQQFSKKEDA